MTKYATPATYTGGSSVFLSCFTSGKGNKGQETKNGKTKEENRERLRGTEGN
jgi:hypothetical protein